MSQNIIFPTIQIRKSGLGESVIETWVRKKGTNRKWYLSHFLRTVYYSNDSTRDMVLFGYLGNFISEVYKFQTLGVIDKAAISLTWNNGCPGIVLDPDQRSEVERVKNL